jgi:hypothetical protein
MFLYIVNSIYLLLRRANFGQARDTPRFTFIATSTCPFPNVGGRRRRRQRAINLNVLTENRAPFVNIKGVSLLYLSMVTASKLWLGASFKKVY